VKRGPLVAIALSLLGCSTDVVIVSYEDGGLDSGGPLCHHNHECGPEAFCSKSGCGELTGRCVLRPLQCPSNFEPVCGCDGVSFWNDCLRQRDGTPGSSAMCEVPFASCDSVLGPGCPVVDAVCSKIEPGQEQCDGGSPAGGVCWVLPDECPADVRPIWQACGSSGPACSDLCHAIASQQPYVRAAPGCP
jgi:hypothetical protein